MPARVREQTYCLVRKLLKLPRAKRDRVLAELGAPDLAALGEAARCDWATWGRPKQRVPEGGKRWRLVVAGRSFGKTRMGSEWIQGLAESGAVEWMSVCSSTVSTTARDLVLGPAGIIACSPSWYRPRYEVVRGVLTYPPNPHTGITPKVQLLSADRPDRIRGSQCGALWIDEVSAWSKPSVSWAMADMTLRLGKAPRGLATFTPKSTAFVRDLVLGPRDDAGQRHPRPDVVVVKGTTFENTSMDPDTLESLRRAYDGALGRQELLGEILEAPEGALFDIETINKYRVAGLNTNVVRVVVGVDPSKTAHGDVAGIVVALLGADGHAYIAEDFSIRAAPLEWARRAVHAANLYHASAVVYESTSLSGDFVKMMHTASASAPVHWKGILQRGSKAVRAAPVSAAYAAGKVHHVGADLEALEIEMTTWDPLARGQESPGRMDALVYAVTELLGGTLTHDLAVR